MSWSGALVLGLLIVGYFVVATVLLPNWALRLVSDASRTVRDAMVLVVWGIGFVAGLVLLRRTQARGLI
jgi:hypothetical protein